MLEYLRNAADKPVAKFLIGILAFSFVGWGVAEWIFGPGRNSNTMMRIGNTRITPQQFSQARSNEFAKLSKEQQRAVYANPAATVAFANSVLTTLASQKLAEERADDLGLMVTDHSIAREVRQYPEFQINGQFSGYMFDNVLQRSGYSEADFTNILRGQVLRSMVLGGVSIPMNVPEFAIDAAYNARYGQRVIDLGTVKYSDFKVADPTEEQLRQFYAQNPQTIPEMRSVSYVLVPAKLDRPDEYDAAQAVAQRVEDAIFGGDSMQVAANANKARFVSYPEFAAGNAPKDKVLSDVMVARIFAMNDGQESEIIETDQGFVILRVDNILPARTAEFNSVRKSLVADWRRSEQKKQAYVRANELLTELKQGNKGAAMRNVTVSRASGAPVQVLAAAFANQVGTQTIVPGDDAFYVMSVNQEIAPKANAAQRENLRQELQKMANRMAMDDYNAFLMREYPVRINQKLLNNITAQ